MLDSRNSKNISHLIFADDNFLGEKSKDIHWYVRIVLVVSECGGTEGNTYKQRKLAVMEKEENTHKNWHGETLYEGESE